MKKEFLFRLGSIALLAVLFVSAKAAADKEENPQQTTGIFANVSLIEEANMINSGALNASRLTTVGDQTETVASTPSLSK